MNKLIFVYNADSGYFNMVTDIAHKIFSPATYPCSLCDLTYGIFTIRPAWDAFVQAAPVAFEFLHKAEFYAEYPSWQTEPLPAVLYAEGEQLSPFISAAEINTLTTIEALKSMVLERLKE